MAVDRRIIDPFTQEELLVPEWATDEDAIQRASARRSSAWRVLNIFPEWGHDWPIWEAGVSHDGSDADDLELPASLRQEISEWYREWAEKTRPMIGWDNHDDRTRWVQHGNALFDQVEKSVWLFAT
ncbi:hypothetical protein [Rathayibacter tanaceti]|uniref:hypothetical protein n=1 Tax=Rathayibacter tanaceti TaxID=1671680 RepID=UPI00128FE2EB|nr:hypothetical protein [Rathayibacter tanaceti]